MTLFFKKDSEEHKAYLKKKEEARLARLKRWSGVDYSSTAIAAANLKFKLEQEGTEISYHDAFVKAQYDVVDEIKWKDEFDAGIRGKETYWVITKQNKYYQALLEKHGLQDKGIKLEEGKYYVRRDGKTIGPAVYRSNRSGSKKWKVQHWYYNYIGKIYSDGRKHELDLVSEGREEDVLKSNTVSDWVNKFLG